MGNPTQDICEHAIAYADAKDLRRGEPGEGTTLLRMLVMALRASRQERDALTASLSRVEDHSAEMFKRAEENYQRALSAENALSRVEGEAREVLAPFAKESVEWSAETWRDDWVPFVDPSGHCGECGEKSTAFERARFTVGDIRRAATLHARLSRADDASGNEGEQQ